MTSWSGMIWNMLTRIAAAVATVALVAGCTLNAGSAFADQYSDYLDTVPEVADHQVRGNNDLPAYGSADTTVTLREGLSDQEIAQTVARLASHRVEQEVEAHRLTVRFWTVNGADEPITVSVSLELKTESEPVSPDAAAALMAPIVKFAAADADLSDLTTGIDDMRATTSGDLFDTAERLAAIAPERPEDTYRIAVSDGVGHVLLFAVDPVDKLRPIADVLKAVPGEVTVTRWRATSQNAGRDPLFEIALAAGTSDDVVAGLESAAQAAGITVKITVAVG